MLHRIYIIQSLHASLTPPWTRHWTLRKLLWRKLVTLMSACSGRNYNFRCINVVFWRVFCASQRVQRRKAELTLAHIREKLPNGWAEWHQIWHTCAHSYGNGYTPNKVLPLETKDGTWRVLGGQQLKSLGKLSDWHQLWFTSADSFGNGHRLHTSRPTIPQRAFGGGGG